MTSHDARPYMIQRTEWQRLAHYDTNGVAHIGVTGVELDVWLQDSYRLEAEDVLQDFTWLCKAMDPGDARHYIGQVFQLLRELSPTELPEATTTGSWTFDGKTGGPVVEAEPDEDEAAGLPHPETKP